jgi:hypothetical protein
VADGDLDLTTDPAEQESAAGLSGLHLTPYNPTHDREKKRGLIALSLVAILGLIVVAALVYVFFTTAPDMDAMKTLLELLFTPIVGLVGAVTGFYFGEKQSST